MKTALAIFTKTKSLTPVKTRLAAEIGRPAADTFFDLSLAAIRELAINLYQNSNGDIIPYWALAEESAPTLPEWKDFNTLWTGEGDLGKRLHTIYDQLRKTHNRVILIGTDSPHLSSGHIMVALEKLDHLPASCVIGPAEDGGFYLFACTQHLPETLWTDVNYSQRTTLAELSSKIAEHNIVLQLLTLENDVDTASDLTLLYDKIENQKNPTPTQKKLSHWLQLHHIIPHEKTRVLTDKTETSC